jgi:hypothetical protein
LFCLEFDTKLQSEVYRDGEEEVTQSYIIIRRGADDDANKGRRMTGSATRKGAHINKIYLTGNYHLQGGNLHATWYE